MTSDSACGVIALFHFLTNSLKKCVVSCSLIACSSHFWELIKKNGDDVIKVFKIGEQIRHSFNQ